MNISLPHQTPLWLTSDIRRIEQAHSHLPLMERAGLATAQLARSIVADGGKPILMVAGPGNNGGDAFVAARYLRQWFHAVSVVFAHDAAQLPRDAAHAFEQWRAAGGETCVTPPKRTWGLIIDGLFGIGLKRPIEGRYADWINAINASNTPVLAIDVPSGLDADTGAVHGVCVRATHTITFIGAKPGLLTLDGPDHCGAITIDDLQLALDNTAAPGSVLNDFSAELPARKKNSHKGTHGSVGIIGGAQGMSGAALLAGRAAQKLGAGRVYVGFVNDNVPAFDPNQPELMLKSADDVLKLDHLSCLAVGPGLGTSTEAAFYLDWAMEKNLPLVIDADALNLIALSEARKIQLKQILTPKILTPHPAEAARLLGMTTRDVQAQRIINPNTLAHTFNAHVVLKGAGSVCASPGVPWRINVSGNPGMATAGMGDVLTGIIAALLAQGMDARDALDTAVWLHGAAADACGVTAGLTASETIDAARKIMNSR